MELLKYVYLYALKSIIKAGNNKFQDLINAPRMYRNKGADQMRGNRAALICAFGFAYVKKKLFFFFHDAACFESLTKASVCVRVQTDHGLCRSNIIKHIFSLTYM